MKYNSLTPVFLSLLHSHPLLTTCDEIPPPCSDTTCLGLAERCVHEQWITFLSDPVPCFLIRVLHGMPTEAYSVSARGYQEPVRLPGACTRAPRRLNPTFAPLPLETAL
ncbi:hypothetical protein BRADI_1g42033v3 [Brachypodium distachyon]|uniref:Secreted protein n=1 Tax=Brachypodium distachyon TaxID=15368 RepID=A0A0Q3H735_BRADI|nr:hypothetical protein BRADI_1g42033v3 [Brachypodium distachyon]